MDEAELEPDLAFEVGILRRDGQVPEVLQGAPEVSDRPLPVAAVVSESCAAEADPGGVGLERDRGVVVPSRLIGLGGGTGMLVERIGEIKMVPIRAWLELGGLTQRVDRRQATTLSAAEQPPLKADRRRGFAGHPVVG